MTAATAVALVLDGVLLWATAARRRGAGRQDEAGQEQAGGHDGETSPHVFEPKHVVGQRPDQRQHNEQSAKSQQQRCGRQPDQATAELGQLFQQLQPRQLELLLDDRERTVDDSAGCVDKCRCGL